MNGALRNALSHPWLASLPFFLPVVAFLGVLFFCVPRPLATADGLNGMPWWAPLVGAFAVIAGLLFVNKVGAGVNGGEKFPRIVGRKFPTSFRFNHGQILSAV